jgi:hypothetical protein
MKAYRYQSKKGTFHIVPSDGQWHPVHEDEWLGGYATPHMALDDLAGGYTFWPSSGLDPSTCGLPDELDDWEVVSFRQ